VLRFGHGAQRLDLGYQREALLHVGRAVERVVPRREDRGERVGVVGAAGDRLRISTERKAAITIAGEVQLHREANQDLGAERRRLRQGGEALLEQGDEALVDRPALVPLVDQHAPEP
jgi:hypothetical protein